MNLSASISRNTAAATLGKSPITGRMLIGGKLVESSGREWIESINPATGEYIGKVPRATATDMERAVSAAEAGQVMWAELSVAQRSNYLFRLADALAARADHLLTVEVSGIGRERGLEELYSYAEEKSLQIFL
jgi:acyl-CoA reductase-like NAD-dependent aldehyde dehydrogenase